MKNDSMPKRTQSHVTADIAVTRVVSIFTELGWACQTVEHDYGEDVFVQSAVNESVDPFRLWVQVKETEDAEVLRNKEGRFVWRVSHDHVLRWIRSLETIVVVLWDIKTDRGYWVEPREEFTEWECYLPDRKQASLLFSESKLFDRAAANKLIWEARITHYSLLIALAKAMEFRILKAKEKDPNAHSDFRNPIHTLTLDLLRALDFIGKDGVSSEERKKIEGVAQRLVKDDPTLPIKRARLSSLLLAILSHAHKKCPGLAVPEDMLFEVVKTAGVAIGVTEAFETGDLK
ncbi:MAG: DUF4365 domain-containing protein [Verrucomicrobiota bacterium]|nr:DUF4365 domain-containing protein [Verrucomicrobiota bacterium]